MRRVAVAMAALLVAGAALAPVDAAAAKRAKPVRFAAKRGVVKQRGGWRAAPKAPRVSPLPAAVDRPAPALPAAEGEVARVEEQAVVAPASAPAAPACDPSPWLGVVAEDAGGFRFRLTRTCVPAGTVLFQFRNTDLADHNLWAEGVEPAAAPRRVVADTPGETVVTASAPLAAGTWRLYCSFAGHEAMSRLLAVTPAG